MEYTRLGAAGVKVSRICLGTMTFGREADEEMSHRLLDRFVELGGNLIDTADVYSTGASERIVGRWLAKRECRDDVVLATKVFGEMGTGPNDRGLSRLHIMQAVENSLRRLQTDVIDLYQMHRWDPEVPAEEALSALDDLVRQGKIRYIGCSNLAAWQLYELLHIAELNGLTRPVSVQPIYNALNRGIELELLPLCADQGLGVINYNPLAGGMLTGKYRRDESMPTGARLEAFKGYYERYYTAQALDIVDAFVLAAQERDVTPAQLAVAWVLGDPRITCPIIGARNLEQFDDTVQGVGVHLSPEERAEIPAVQPGTWVGNDPVYG
jgi:aryl-alcohol dehydrogenase-like predicted oxidoreductase